MAAFCLRIKGSRVRIAPGAPQTTKQNQLLGGFSVYRRKAFFVLVWRLVWHFIEMHDLKCQISLVTMFRLTRSATDSDVVSTLTLRALSPFIP